MKKIEVQMLLYTFTKNFMEVQWYILNPFIIVLFYKVMWWFDGQNIGVEPMKPNSIPFTNIYYVKYVYLYIYFVHVCKCIIHKWVVNR
jgi:hypothetical protein